MAVRQQPDARLDLEISLHARRQPSEAPRPEASGQRHPVWVFQARMRLKWNHPRTVANRHPGPQAPRTCRGFAQALRGVMQVTTARDAAHGVVWLRGRTMALRGR